MTDINNVNIVGRLVRDIQLEYTPGGMAVAKGSVAVNRGVKGKDGKWADVASFFEFVIFGKTAKNLNGRLLKGVRVTIDGYLKQDRWTGQDGKNHSKIYIGVNLIQIHSPSGQSQTNEYSNSDEYSDNGFDSSYSYN